MKLPLTLSLPEGQGHPSLNDSPIIVDDTSGELILIELQGELELSEEGGGGDDNHDDDRAGQPVMTVKPAGQKIGRLDLSVASRPILQIGHHRLVGQLVKLNTPIAILKHTLPATATALSSGMAHIASSPLRQHNDSNLNSKDATGDLSGPSRILLGEYDDTKKRKNSCLDNESTAEIQHGESAASPSNKSPRLNDLVDAVTPFQPRTYRNQADKAREQEEEEEAMRISNNHAQSSPLLAPPHPHPTSSAISNRTQAPTTPFNVTELKRGQHEIVGILRKKLLFSKRPEPIVRLEEYSDDD